MTIFKFRNLKTGQATPISSGEFTIGRDGDADVPVDDSSVSRHHARLVNNEDGFFLEDLGSANGVALQGEYVTGRVPLKFGDLIHIGKVPFRIDPEVLLEAPSPAPPVAAPPTASEGTSNHVSAPLEPAAIPVTAKDELPVAPAITFSASPDQPSPNIEPAPSGPLIRHSVPLPKLIKLTEPAASAEETRENETGGDKSNAEGASLAPVIQYGENVQWWWWLIMFLAGLGSGLLLGLYFAKLFLDFGGKPAGLPG